MGGTGLLSGTLLPWFSGGMGPPQAKLLSNTGRRVAGHSLLLSQEASPTSKDRANTPHKTLEGQGNADESEKIMNTSHTSACFPSTGRKSCYSRGPQSLLTSRAGFLQRKQGLSCPLNLCLFCKQDKPISKEWASPKATRCYSCTADSTSSQWLQYPRVSHVQVQRF